MKSARTDSPTVLCDYCGAPAKLLTGAQVYPGLLRLHRKFFYVCRPCEAWVGVHEGTRKPLGRLANARLRRLKSEAHAAFDPLWKGTSSPPMRRSFAYEWLAEELGIPREKCHIGMFDVDECTRAIQICRAKMRELSAKDCSHV